MQKRKKSFKNLKKQFSSNNLNKILYPTTPKSVCLARYFETLLLSSVPKGPMIMIAYIHNLERA